MNIWDTKAGSTIVLVAAGSIAFYFVYRAARNAIPSGSDVASGLSNAASNVGNSISGVVNDVTQWARNLANPVNDTYPDIRGSVADSANRYAIENYSENAERFSTGYSSLVWNDDTGVWYVIDENNRSHTFFKYDDARAFMTARGIK